MARRPRTDYDRRVLDCYLGRIKTPRFSADFAYHSLPTIMAPILHAWTTPRGQSETLPTLQAPYPAPKHELARQEFLSFPDSPSQSGSYLGETAKPSASPTPWTKRPSPRPFLALVPPPRRRCLLYTTTSLRPLLLSGAWTSAPNHRPPARERTPLPLACLMLPR